MPLSTPANRGFKGPWPRRYSCCLISTCDHYRELIRYFADKDPTTRVMMEGILTNEEEPANDMADLLVAHEGKPMLHKEQHG
jgi:hypothetical protein